MSGRWQFGIYRDSYGAWEFSGQYPDPQSAIVAMTTKLGLVLLGEVEENSSWRVTSPDDPTFLGCVRQLVDQPTTQVGGKPVGSPGPLRRYRGLTWVGWVNFIFLRWFLLRISYVVEEDGSISGYGLRFVPTWRW